MYLDTLKNLFPAFTNDNKFMEELARTVIPKSYAKGDTIIDYGDFIRSVPLVVKGLIKVMRENEEGKEVLLYHLSAGYTCAASFSCCMVRKRSEIKVICDEDCIIYAIPLEIADRWMSEFSIWRNFIFTMYDNRMFALIDTIDKLAFSQLDEKLIDYLEELALHKRTKEIKISHAEIANDLNVSREAVSRLLKKLETQEEVKLDRGRITMLNA